MQVKVSGRGRLTCILHVILDGYLMKRKVAQTELEPAEYSTLAATARKKGLTIKEALREAALRWSQEESGINPSDPIFHVKARDWGRGTENASREVDETVYG